MYFFAYPASPDLHAQTLAEAAARLGAESGVSASTWQDIAEGPSGIIFSDIRTRIQESSVIVLDLTGLNENVLLEFGLAVAENKAAVVLIDETVEGAWNTYRLFAPLRGVRAHQYASSGDISSFLLSTRPDLNEAPTIFTKEIAPRIQGSPPPYVFYVPRNYSTDFDIALNDALEGAIPGNIELRVADPYEGTEDISWYGRQVAQASAVVCHLAELRRVNAQENNRLASLAAGLALGFRRPLIIVAPKGARTVFDLEGFTSEYESRASLQAKVADWIHGSALRGLSDEPRHLARAKLAEEVALWGFGEHVAEREADDLAGYFYETNDYRVVVRGRTAIVVGRKGAGKTAAVKAALRALRNDAGRLVVEIAPPTYDIEALMALFERILGRSMRLSLGAALWRYLLMTEIVVAAHSGEAVKADQRPHAVTDEDRAFSAAVEESGLVAMSFAGRLEAAVRTLRSSAVEAPVEEDEAAANRLTELLYGGPLKDLRGLVRQALHGRSALILLDNLDKAWQPGADLEKQSMFLLSLLAVVPEMKHDLNKSNREAEASVDAVVFLRSDIFARVRVHSREPDKLPVHYMAWPSHAALHRVIEERYASAVSYERPGERVWERIFPQRIDDVPTKEHILRRVLPRPRDVIFLCNAALESATMRDAGRVEKTDVVAAEQRYSAHAVDTVLVEAGDQRRAVESALFALMGAEGSVMTMEAAIDLVVDDCGTIEEAQRVVGLLRELSVIGLEVRRGVFEFAEANPTLGERTRRLAERLKTGTEGQRILVHPAYCPYLELPDVNVSVRYAGFPSEVG